VTEVRHCRTFLDIELEALTKKKVIILMGAAPVKALVGHGSVNEMRGRPFPWADDPEVTLVPTFSPGMFSYNPNPQKVAMYEGDLRQARDLVSGDAVQSVTDVTVVESMEDFNGLLQDIASHSPCRVACDIETSGLSARLDVITDLSFSAKAGTAYVVPIREWVGDKFKAVAPDKVVEFAKALLADEGVMKIWHGGKFDYTFLVEKGWIDYETLARQYWMDTMYFHYIGVDETYPHTLEFLAGSFTNMNAWDSEKLAFEAIHGSGSLYRMPYLARALYAGGDADATWRLSEELPKRSFDGAWDVYNTIMKPLLPGIIEMQVNGVGFDFEQLNECRAMYIKKVAVVQQEIYDMFNDGEEWNIGSVDQVVDRLTRIFKFKWLPPDTHKRLWTKTLSRPSLSTATGARDEWSELLPHPFWAVYTQFTMLNKLINTYTGSSESDFSDKSLPASVCPQSKRIHTSISPSVTATSRRSSSDPNLQNIPVRSEEGMLLRKCFIADDGFMFCVPDLDTAEAWVAAYISDDQKMIKAFEDPNINLHTLNASLLFGMPYDEIGGKSPQRFAAKIFLFGTLYGGQPASLARKMTQVGIPVSTQQVQIMAANFMREYEGYAAWRQKQIQHVIEHGWNETLYRFRRRYVWPSTRWQQHEIERQLCNLPIQGTVAGHVAVAYRRVQIALRTGIVDGVCYREGGYDGRLIMEIHDELVAEVREDQAPEFLPVMIKAMTHNVPTIGKPIPVSGDIRKRWLPEKDED
jgi:DNA polymerase-1